MDVVVKMVPLGFGTAIVKVVASIRRAFTRDGSIDVGLHVEHMWRSESRMCVHDSVVMGVDVDRGDDVQGGVFL